MVPSQLSITPLVVLIIFEYYADVFRSPSATKVCILSWVSKNIIFQAYHFAYMSNKRPHVSILRHLDDCVEYIKMSYSIFVIDEWSLKSCAMQ